MAAGFQAGAQLFVVVYFAVEYDLDGTVLVAERLAPASQVDDRQPAVDQADSRLLPEAFAVGAAVREDTAHGVEQVVRYRTIGIGVKDTGNAAHSHSPSRRTTQTRTRPLRRVTR